MLRLFDKIRRTPLTTTVRLPDRLPLGARGFPVVDASRCAACDACKAACPTGALTRPADGGTLDLGRCLTCGACVAACPTGAISVSRQHLRAVAPGRDLVVPAADPARATEPDGPIHNVLGRSLQIRHVDAGSCNGCDWEMTHLLGPAYDLQRFGIDFVASPRHADMLLVTGGVTRHLEQALARTIDAAGEPKLVVAIGTCACGGGIAGPTYACRGGVPVGLPGVVCVPGCPPRPEAILQGILLAVGRSYGA